MDCCSSVVAILVNFGNCWSVNKQQLGAVSLFQNQMAKHQLLHKAHLNGHEAIVPKVDIKSILPYFAHCRRHLPEKLIPTSNDRMHFATDNPQSPSPPFPRLAPEISVGGGGPAANGGPAHHAPRRLFSRRSRTILSFRRSIQ